LHLTIANAYNESYNIRIAGIILLITIQHVLSCTEIFWYCRYCHRKDGRKRAYLSALW